MNNDKSTSRDLFRKQVYDGQSSIKCVVCKKSHNLKSYKSRFVICSRDECFEFQKVFDPLVKNDIITKGAVCDKSYNKFRYANRKRKAATLVS